MGFRQLPEQDLNKLIPNGKAGHILSAHLHPYHVRYEHFWPKLYQSNAAILHQDEICEA